MTKLLVLYYSSYGHIETMAGAIAEGVREVPDAEVTIKRVPELVPEESARQHNFKLDQAAPIATVDELPQYDAILFGTPTRFGNMCAQMRNFLDQTGKLWMSGALIGKVGSVFARYCQPAWRAGDHHYLIPQHAATPWHDHRRVTLCGPGLASHGGNLRRNALWRYNACGR